MFGYLELLLIHMIRRYFAPQAQLPIDPARSARRHEVTYHTVLQYLEEHIRESVSIEKICHDNLIGRSQLHKLFNERHQCGVIDYFSQMKISMARQLIREQQMNFTQISDFLGYSSVHYFSRQFKKITGMTPTEYAFSVKAKSEQ
jgi:YesN/AraC family two-component response regulator